MKQKCTVPKQTAEATLAASGKERHMGTHGDQALASQDSQQTFARAPNEVWTVSQTSHFADGLTYHSETPLVCFELTRGHCPTGVWLREWSPADACVQVGGLREGLFVEAR